jgi:hypothetical protein
LLLVFLSERKKKSVNSAPLSTPFVDLSDEDADAADDGQHGNIGKLSRE